MCCVLCFVCVSFLGFCQFGIVVFLWCVWWMCVRGFPCVLPVRYCRVFVVCVCVSVCVCVTFVSSLLFLHLCAVVPYLLCQVENLFATSALSCMVSLLHDLLEVVNMAHFVVESDFSRNCMYPSKLAPSPQCSVKELIGNLDLTPRDKLKLSVSLELTGTAIYIGVGEHWNLLTFHQWLFGIAVALQWLTVANQGALKESPGWDAACANLLWHDSDKPDEFKRRADEVEHKPALVDGWQDMLSQKELKFGTTQVRSCNLQDLGDHNMAQDYCHDLGRSQSIFISQPAVDVFGRNG